MATEKLAFSIRETRENLGGISNATMYKLISDGEIATFNIGRRRFVSHESIRDYIRKQEKRATKPAMQHAIRRQGQ